MKNYKFETTAILAILFAMLMVTFRNTKFAEILCIISAGSVLLVVLYMFFGFFHTATMIVSGDFMEIGPAVEPDRHQGAVIVYRRLYTYPDQNGNPVIMGARGGDWKSWKMQAKNPPAIGNTDGIYGFHDAHDKGLEEYKNGTTILVKTELRGDKVIHKRGSRGQFGTVVGIISAEKNAYLPKNLQNVPIEK